MNTRLVNAGPDVGFSFTIGGLPTYANVHGYWDFWAQYYIKGKVLFLHGDPARSAEYKKGFNPMLRLHSPLELFFTKQWQLKEVERTKSKKETQKSKRHSTFSPS